MTIQPTRWHDQTIYRRNNRQIGFFERACGFEYIKSEFLGQLIFHLFRRLNSIKSCDWTFVSYFSTLKLWNYSFYIFNCTKLATTAKKKSQNHESKFQRFIELFCFVLHWFSFRVSCFERNARKRIENKL